MVAVLYFFIFCFSVLLYFIAVAPVYAEEESESLVFDERQKKLKEKPGVPD